VKDHQAMKKLIVSVVIVGVFVFYSFLHDHSSVTALAPNSATGTSGAPSSAPTPGTTSTSSGQYKDGSYTGSVADAQWGYLQVKAIIQGGKIMDVQFVQYPNDRSRSVMINQYADPQLTSEAIQAQSAQVDIITGATDSSEAFMQSLTDALSQAQA
jgi:uncharacterized protein with FMN-binding domain